MDNADNLSRMMIEELRGTYEGTRLGDQELYGKLLLDIPGALWTADMMQRASVPPALDRVVVAVDPSGAKDEKSGSDEIGILVAGIRHGKTRHEDQFYVLEDATLVASPQKWAERAVKALEDWAGDRIVAESNYGGAMVEATIKNANPNVPVTIVTATRGKVVRAEPVAALYEQSRVHHCGQFSALEGQMCAMTVTGYVGDRSPDRVDALVWAITDLMERRAAPVVMTGGDTRPSYWTPGR
jgi:phage terminase large subunit-like protein